MFERRSWRCVLLALVTLISPVFASAQTPLGRVAGTVLDPSGGVLPGATITLTNIGTGQAQTSVSNENGTFLFPQVPVGSYKIAVQLEGFKVAEFTDAAVAVGQEYSLTAKLELGTVTDVVTVEAGASLVHTTSPEVTSTVMQGQVLNIPLANRDITNLIKLQAGVPGIAVRSATAINGGRPTWTQVTLDGINIQDNFIRTNSLDFLPNRPTSDNVAEFSITSSVSGADAAGGATTVRMVTPSGTNRFTGSVFEFNRDSNLAANSFFNNASQLPKAELSRHQYGGRIGGPIQRDRMFFFFNYEGMRQDQQPASTMVIPANPDFFNGVFRYVDSAGGVRAVNVMELSGLSIDPVLQTELFALVPASSNVNTFNVGNSSATRLLNTAGYRFLQEDRNDRDSYTGRLDYSLSSSHKLEGVFSRFTDYDDRTDLDVVSQQPLIFAEFPATRYAAAWRSTLGSRFSNEVRGGANLGQGNFITNWDFDDGVLYTFGASTLNLTSPIAVFQSQGRFTDTYQLSNTANYVKGNHQFQMGGSWQRNKVDSYGFAGQYPTATFGFSAIAPANVQLTSAQFPGGISAADLGSANAMASFLGGVVTQVAQTFQTESQTSGYVAGIPQRELYTLDNVAAYIQDNWRWKPNFTVRGGLKWEYYSPVSEDNNLGFMPLLNGRSFDAAMLDPTTTIGFLTGPFYNKDLNNFGPTAGFAWDVTRDGKTAVRGGYSLTFVNEETMTVASSLGRGNAGLSTQEFLANQYTTVAAGVPSVPTPVFLPERTQANQMASNPAGILWGIDPDIQAAHVHQVSIGIQRELPWSLAAEARYVGSFGRDIWRGTDFNQIAYSDEFFADFNRARTNGYLAQQAGLAFNPSFNATVPGSQPLTLLPNLGIALTNANLIASLQQSEVGRLADLYMTGLGTPAAREQARAMFLQNPGIYSANGITNGGFSDFNSLQLELRRQFRNGFFAQVNYTFADSKTDSDGQGQNRFEARMDNNRPDLTVGRSTFHITHVMNANAIYELPFGRDRRWLNGGGLVEMLAGGWQVGTIVTLQSGQPFSIFSGRGTFNRVGRSDCATVSRCNTAVSTLSVAEIQDLIGVYKQPDGTIYWIDPRVINASTGRAVGADNLTNAAGFDGQVFFNPAAGEVGNLPVMAFDGPKTFRMDLALSKRTRIGSRYSFELKAEAFNLTNTASFSMSTTGAVAGDRNINSTTFGRITGVDVASRVVQLSARFNF